MTHSPILNPFSVSSDPLLVPEHERFIRDLERFLQSLCLNANHLDHDANSLQQAFFQLGERSLLGLKGPRDWGGTQLHASLFSWVQETVARYSGALAFLQTQHQSAVAKLSRCENHSLKQQYLADAIQGRIGIGVGFSQLRRSGLPLVQAVPIKGGYCINGQVPWITGYGCFQQFILGATLPDNRIVFGLLPLETTTQTSGGRLILSQPMKLAAMTATNTITATLEHWVLPAEQVLQEETGDWIHQSDRKNNLNHSFFALGCARAGLDILDQASHRHASPSIQSTWAILDQALNGCREKIYTAHAKAQADNSESSDDRQVSDRLRLRAEAIDLAVRCAHAAVIVSRGAANILDHPAQRIYREALAFSVLGQTTAVMEASLAQIVN